MVSPACPFCDNRVGRMHTSSLISSPALALTLTPTMVAAGRRLPDTPARTSPRRRGPALSASVTAPGARTAASCGPPRSCFPRSYPTSGCICVLVSQTDLVEPLTASRLIASAAACVLQPHAPAKQLSCRESKIFLSSLVSTLTSHALSGVCTSHNTYADHRYPTTGQRPCTNQPSECIQ